MPTIPQPVSNRRIGFHYYPDTLHFRQIDLQYWLPVLKSLGASWLTIHTPLGRAIPEFFIQNLIQEGIEPVLQFQTSIKSQDLKEPLNLLLETYRKWGIHYISFLEKPNLRSSWSTAAWIHFDLVEKFLDIYLPLANLALNIGLLPIFPSLEPGGDYWDLVFLQSSLRSLQRRNQNQVLDSLLVGADASVRHSITEWGSGGPDEWPTSIPYFTPEDSQDQRGFFIFDWYSSVIKHELSEEKPIFLFRAGFPVEKYETDLQKTKALSNHSSLNLQLFEFLLGISQRSILPRVPENVVACNFWLLTSDYDNPERSQAWIQPDGVRLPVVDAISKYVNSQPSCHYLELFKPDTSKHIGKNGRNENQLSFLDHYLLLPLYNWGVAEWDLETIRPFLIKNHPTLGFSLEEAINFRHVTFLETKNNQNSNVLQKLLSAGCIVDRMMTDGTIVASSSITDQNS